MSNKQVMQLFLAALAAIYLTFLGGLVVFQRRLMYFPTRSIGTAESYGLKGTETLRLPTATGQTIVAWYRPAASDKPVYLFFHGNGGNLATRVDLLHWLAADGSGFMAIDYEGYGASTGAPSEIALLNDGEAAYAELRRRGWADDRIVVLGESLGTGVAVAVAAAHPIRALVLDAAYTSTVDIAAAHYWVFPVRLLMIDTFKSIDRIAKVTAPKLFLHGTDDDVIPITSGRELFAAAAEPKTFIDYPDEGHMVMSSPEVIKTMKDWLAVQPIDITPAGSVPSPPR